MNLSKTAIRDVMSKVLPFFLFLVAVLFAACDESKTEKSDVNLLLKSQEVTARQKSQEFELPLVGDVAVICGTVCKDPSEIKVYKAPFDVREPFEQSFEIEPGASLSLSKIHSSEARQTRFLKPLYQKYLERMQSENGDSAYFAGKIILKLSIGENGFVDEVSVLSSTTGNTQFDHEVRDSIRTWIFPKADGKSVVSFPLEFVKTKYSKGDVEIVKSGL